VEDVRDDLEVELRPEVLELLVVAGAAVVPSGGFGVRLDRRDDRSFAEREPLPGIVKDGRWPAYHGDV
jgi:hypothetical protein